MKKYRILLSITIVFMTALTLSAPSAYGAEKNVIKQKEVMVPAKQSVENVIVFGHDAIVKGKVKTAVIVINGDVDIKKKAKVKELVLVIGGHVKQEAGSKVTDNIIAVNLNSPSQNSLFLGGMVLISGWLLRLIANIVLVFLTVIAGLSLHKRTNRLAGLTKGQAPRLILSGAIISAALLAVSVLLAITVIGIPVSILLLLFPVLVFITGLAIYSHQLAAQISSLENKPPWIQYLTGSFLLVSLFNFPIIGSIFFFLLFFLSLGGAFKFLFERFRARKTK
ncbi:hypothetical protein [Fictibacillus fluitans]|uniref:Polymer-forming cytoskeletal protein n=1 Tax=Fictibacillus fluitans TaxID=3058422 RepID=A0ABT8HUV6_9BACL|nr:hypothetical protein [Fictibacillus sp. NE201]MDN4524551.1 hypothetical protein [Fictibacillus sp. NE201]